MSEKTNSWCPVCSMPAHLETGSDRHKQRMECPRCGEYTVGEKPETSLGFSPKEIANASGYIRANSGFHLAGIKDIEFLRSLRTPTVGKKAEKLLRYFAHLHPVPGTKIEIPFGVDDWVKKHRRKNISATVAARPLSLSSAKKKLSLLSYCWVQGEDDLDYILFDYLVESSENLWS